MYVWVKYPWLDCKFYPLFEGAFERCELASGKHMVQTSSAGSCCFRGEHSALRGEWHRIMGGRTLFIGACFGGYLQPVVSDFVYEDWTRKQDIKGILRMAVDECCGKMSLSVCL